MVKTLDLRHPQGENITKDGDNSNCKVGMPKSNIAIIWIMHLSGMWLGVNLTTTKKPCV